MSRIANDRRVRAVLVFVVLVLSLARIASYLQYTHEPHRTRNDFTADYVSAREWMSGGDPYAPQAWLYDRHLRPGETRPPVEADQLNPHPPILVVLSAPIARLGVGPAHLLILLADLAAIFAAVYLFCLRLSMSRRRAVIVAAGVLALPLVQYEVRWGQINGLILLALVLGWRARARSGDRRTGVAFGLAAAVKIYPWLLVVPLLRQRRFRAAGWMLGTALAATAAGLLVLGPAATVRWATVASARNLEAWGTAPHGLSIAALPFRLFASGRWGTPGVPIAAWVAVASLVAGAACVLGAARTRASASDDLVWATVPWMVLASPIAWPHYLVAAIPLGILVVANRNRVSRPARAAALVSIALLGIASPFSEWVPLDYASVLVCTSLVIGALLCLAVLDFAGLLSSRPAARSERTGPPHDGAAAPHEPSSSPAPPQAVSPAARRAERARV